MPTEEIFIIEDDPHLVELLISELTGYLYRVRVAGDGRTALLEIQKELPGLVILDLMLPGLDGWEICRLLKDNPVTKAVPILILSGRVQEEDFVKGLASGADGYLGKPFGLKELVARIRAMLRRSRMDVERKVSVHLRMGPLAIDVERHSVRMGEKELKLTPTEFHLLKYLTQNAGKVFTRDHLLTALWGGNKFIEEHNLDVHIHSLRRKLEWNPVYPRLLLTVRGIGYKFQNPYEVKVTENSEGAA